MTNPESRRIADQLGYDYVAELPAQFPGDAIAALTGRLAQVPPAFSAKHVNGERAYAIARRGDVVDLPPVSVHVMH